MTAPRRVVVITGAGGALGAAVSHRLAGEPDTDLVLSDVSAPSLEATVAGLPDRAGGVETALADVSDPDQVESVVALAVERFGRLDVLISNAGVLSANGRIHNLATEEWERAFRINVLGAVNGIRAAVGVMRPQRSGSIVLTASVSGLTAWSHAAPYCATKAAVIQLAKVAAVEYARDGIRVNCVCPGSFRSAIHDDLPAGGGRRHRRAAIPWGSARPTTSSAPTRTWPATARAGPPARPWSSTAATRRRDRMRPPARRSLAGDPADEDLGERFGHVAGRQRSARLQPQVGVVVHAQPGQGGQPRVERAELARVDAGPEDRLDPALVLASPALELLGPLAGERRELVQEDPDVVGVAMDDVQQLVAEHGQLLRRRAARLGDPVGAEHHLVHHPVVDGDEERFLGADVVVEGALAEVVGGTQLVDARGVVAAPGEDARRRVDDRLATELPPARAWRIARRVDPCHLPRR